MITLKSGVQGLIDMKDDTPLTDAIEKTRKDLKQPRTAPYGDMMAHAKRLEKLVYDQAFLIHILSSKKSK